MLLMQNIERTTFDNDNNSPAINLLFSTLKETIFRGNVLLQMVYSLIAVPRLEFHKQWPN
jgi:hypothetical protein